MKQEGWHPVEQWFLDLYASKSNEEMDEILLDKLRKLGNFSFEVRMDRVMYGHVSRGAISHDKAVATIWNTETKERYDGIAYCSLEDKNNPHFGMALALLRAMQNAEKVRAPCCCSKCHRNMSKYIPGPSSNGAPWKGRLSIRCDCGAVTEFKR